MLLVLNMLLTSLSIVSLFLNTILLYEKKRDFHDTTYVYKCTLDCVVLYQ